MALLKSSGFALLAAATLLFAGCDRDLTIPAEPLRGRISGSVDTQGHIPPEWVNVVLIAADGARRDQVAAADGTFVFGDLIPGDYYIELDVPGFAPMVRPNIAVRGGTTFEAGVLAPTWLEGTPEEATVTGKVIINGDGTALGGQVEFYLQPLNQRVALTAIGMDGEFVQRIPPGAYRLRARHPLFVTAELNNVVAGKGESVDLTQQPLAMDINPATITGTVLRERDGLEAVPAEGVLVTLLNGDTTTTDQNGAFSLGGLSPQAQTVRFTLAGHHDLLPPRAVTLTPGEVTTVDPVTLALDRGTLTGEVELADAQPARDVTVVVSGTAYSAVAVPDATVSSVGRFKLSGVPVGTYEVAATKARYSRAAKSPVTVTRDGTLDVGRMTLAVLQGDFTIDDADTTNTPGYTATRAVTLDLSGFGSPAAFRASEDATFTGVDFVSFTGAVQPFTLDVGDTVARQGTHVVYAQYRDAQGNVSPTFSASIVLDTTAPVANSVVINSGTGFTRTASPLTLTLDAQEGLASEADVVSGLSKVLLSESATLTGGRLTGDVREYRRTLSFTPSALTEGVRDVYVQFVDHAGNASAVLHEQVVVDTLPPTGSISIATGAGAEAGFTRQALVELSQSADAEPNGGHVLIKLANSSAALNTAVLQPVQAVSSWFLDPTTQGLKTVYARLQDAAGNTSDVLQAQITYDSVAPNPASVSIVEASPTRASSITLQLTAESPLSSTEAVTASEDLLFLDATTAGPYAFPGSSTLPFPLSSGDGVKQVYVRFRDRAGNEAVASAKITRDDTPPVASFTIEGSLRDGTASSVRTYTTSVKLRIDQTGGTSYAVGDIDTLVDCATASYSTLSSSTLDHVLTGTGSLRRVALCVRDDAGNSVGPLIQSIELDPDPPMGCALALSGRKVDGSAAPAGKTASPNVTATIAGCSEPPVEMALANAPLACSASLNWVPYGDSTAHVLAGPDGTNQVYGCVRDAARNMGTIASASITLDTVAPLGPVVSLDDGAAYVNAAQVTARGGRLATATGSATGASEWAIGLTPTPSSFAAIAPVEVTFPADGEQVVYAVFRDDVGNATIAVSDGIVFDTVAPDAATALLDVEPDGRGYTRDTEVALQLLVPVDATRMQVATAASTAGCASSDFAAALQVAVASRYDHVLTSGDGLKRVCVRFLDGAGNPSNAISGTITLDTLAPSGCAIALAGFKADGSTPPAGKTASPKIEGAVSGCSETPVESYVTGAAITCTQGMSLPWQTYEANFTFLLEGLDGAKTVKGCVRDAAGNVGTLNEAVITLDTTPPAAPSIVIDSGAEYVNADTVTARGGYFADVAGSATGEPLEWALVEDPTKDPSWLSYASDNPITFAFAGEGRQSLYAMFRDDVGNTSAMTTDLITFDTVGPDVSTATLVGDVGGNGYTPSVSVVVGIYLAKEVVADVDRMVVGQAASAGAGCVAGDLSAADVQPFSSSFTFLIDSAEGKKRLCAKVVDAAGNPSSFVPSVMRPNGSALRLDEVVLDTTDPSVPEIITASAVRSVPTGTAQVVQIRLPVTEANFSRYERLGGEDRTWVTASTDRTTTSFTYTLYSDATRAAGFQNVLRLRARDLAGNTSEASVVITTDVSPPTPVELNKFWVSNGDGKATVRWKKSASSDVIAYRVYYGAASNTYNGFLADQGSSPVEVPANATNLTLSGITSGSPVYATVKAVDHAYNESTVLPSPATEVRLQPNVVSPNQLGTITTTIPFPTKLVRYEDVLYVVGFTAGGSSGLTRIEAIDLAGLTSPLLGGQIRDPAPALPGITSSQSFTDSPSFEQTNRGGADFAVQGQFGFLAAGTKLRIFDLTNPLVPALLYTVEFSTFTAWKVQVRGNRAVLQGRVGGNTVIRQLSLAKLFDETTGGPVWPDDGLGDVSYATISPPGGLAVSRHVGFSFASNGGNAYTANLNTFALQGGASTSMITQGSPTVSGNYLYVSHMFGFSVFNLNPIWGTATNDLNAAPRLANVQAAGGGGFEVQGTLAAFTDTASAGVRMLDLSDVTFATEAGQLYVEDVYNPSHVAWWGNFMFVAGNTKLAVFEAATPSALRERARSPEGGAFSEVTPGLWFNGGRLMDLHQGATPVELVSAMNECSYGGARFGERVAWSGGSTLQVFDFEGATDRNGTPATTLSDSASLGTSVTRVHEIAAYGAYLIAVTTRADGTWVEVFDGRKLLDRSAALNALNLDTDRKGAVKLSASIATGGNYAQLAMYRGRAFVTIQTDTAATDGLYVADLRPLLDDSATGSASFQGFVTGATLGARGVVAGAGFAYFTSNGNINVADVSLAMDDDPATVISNAASAKASFSAANPEALALSGNYLMMLPTSGTLMVLDVSTPLVPKMLATMPFSRSVWNCGVGGQTTYIRSKLSVVGPRVYVSHLHGARIVDLE